MSALKPLAIGEIVDRSVSFWRSQWRALFQLFLGFQLVQYILLKGLEVATARFAPALQGGLAAIEAAQAHPEQVLQQALPALAGIVTVVLLNVAVGQIAGVATTHFVFPRLVDTGTPSVVDALRLAGQRLWPTLGTFALTFAWTALVGLGFLLPGALTVGGGVFAALQGSTGLGAALAIIGAGLSGLGLAVLVVWFLVRFVLTSQVIAIEGLGAVGCFRRTDALSSGRVGPGFGGWVKGRLTILITIVAVIVTVMSFITSLPELALKGVTGGFDPTRAALDSSAPQWLLVPAQLIQVIAGAVIAPLYVVFQVIFYLDMRVRREGLDLELASTRKADP